MAIATTELKKLQKQVSELQKLQRQVAQLQKRVAQLEKKQQPSRNLVPKPKNNLTERERAIKILREAGITRELTPREKAIAARWRALSQEEKDEVNRELRAVRIDPPLSQLIHDMRG